MCGGEFLCECGKTIARRAPAIWSPVQKCLWRRRGFGDFLLECFPRVPLVCRRFPPLDELPLSPWAEWRCLATLGSCAAAM